MLSPNQPTIQLGASGDVVRLLQRSLRRTPNLKVTIDGVFGPETLAAAQEFQRDARLLNNGIVGPETWATLPDGRPMPQLQTGLAGDVVKALQQVLTDGAPGQWKKTPGAVDGEFGPATEELVKAFQTWAGVAADGIVADETWSASLHAAGATLESAVGLNFASPPPFAQARGGGAVLSPNQPTIQLGANGDVVRLLQRSLRRTPNLKVTIDGVFGPETLAAAQEFQRDARLLNNGIVGPETWATLPDGRPMPQLQTGLAGDVVKALQQVLTDGAPGQWKKTPGAVDGEFGPATEELVKAFQTWAGVAADGIVADETWSASLHAAGATLESAVGLNFASPPPFAQGDVKLTVTSKFMQDYTTAQPVLETLALEETFVAQDDTLNVYSPVGFKQPQATPSITRLYATTTTPTGWAVKVHPLPTESPAPQIAPSGGVPEPWLSPTVVIAPSARPGKHNLLLFRQDSIQSTALGADGSVDGTFATKEKTPSVPMLHGRLADGTRYLPELEVDSSGAVHQLLLRDLRSMKAYVVDGAAIPVAKGLSGAQRAIFPIFAGGEGFYRFVALEETGAVTMSLLRLEADSGKFVVMQRQVITQAPSNCIAVREVTPWRVEVFIVNVPELQVITILETRDPNSVGSWTRSITAKLTGMPPVDPNAPKRFKVIAAPEAGATNLMLFAQPQPPADWRTGNMDFADRSGDWACAKAPAEIWATTRSEDQFAPMVPVDRVVRFVSFLAKDAQSFLAYRPDSGFEVWRRGDSGDLQIEAIRVQEEDAPPIDTACHRVGVTMNLGAQPLAGQDFEIKASLPAFAAIGGRTVVITPERAAQAMTDATGTLWVNVSVEKRLLLPTLTLSCPLFDHDVVVDIGESIRTRLSTITASELKDAADPRTGKKVLGNPDHADAVAGAITELMKKVPAAAGAQPAIVGAAPGAPADPARIPQLDAHPQVRARLLPRTEAAQALAPLAIRDGASWRLSLNEGQLRFEMLEPAAAAGPRRLLGVRRDVPPVGSWYDPSSWHPPSWIDPRSWIDHLKSGFELVVGEGNAALTLVVDGVEKSFQFAIGNVGHVFDAIYWVLDQAGVELGTMIGWLLKQLGFLFPWEAFLGKRDELRELVRARARAMTATLPDPGPAFASAGAKLDDYDAQIVSYLSSLRHGPSGNQSVGGLLGRQIH